VAGEHPVIRFDVQSEGNILYLYPILGEEDGAAVSCPAPSRASRCVSNAGSLATEWSNAVPVPDA